jgi:hypothetical protein
MPLLGQASGAWTESSSALRLLHVGVRNTTSVLTSDAFTQTNPPILTTANTVSQSEGMNTLVFGVLSGSVAFSRPDVGSNYVGGPTEPANDLHAACTRPLGLFINNAAGNSFSNAPAAASGVGPYVSGQGVYASSLYETRAPSAEGAYAQGDTLTYACGMPLMASRNGYLIPMLDSAAADVAVAAWSSEVTNSQTATTIAICKMPADSVQPEIVFDQRI